MNEVGAGPSLRPSAIPRTRAWGIGLALVTSVISGVSVFTNGYAVRHFAGSGAFTTAKNAVAAVFLVGLVAAFSARHSEDGWTPARTGRERMGLLVVGVVGGSVPFVFFFEGLSRASSSDAAFIHKTLVVWVAILGVLLLRERLSWLHIGAIAVLVVGQAALTQHLADVTFGAGEVLIFAATLLWSIEIVVAKKLLGSLSSLTVGVSRMVIGAVVLVGWLLATGQLGDLLHFSASQWGWILLTALLLTGYVATWFAGLARAQAVDVTAILVFGAVITAALNGLFAGVPLRSELIGLALVIAAVAVVAIVPPRRPVSAT